MLQFFYLDLAFSKLSVNKPLIFISLAWQEHNMPVFLGGFIKARHPKPAIEFYEPMFLFIPKKNFSRQ